MIKCDDLKVGIDIEYRGDSYHVKYIGTDLVICDCTTMDGEMREVPLKRATILLHGNKMKKKKTYYMALYRNANSSYVGSLIFPNLQARKDYKMPHGHKSLKYFEVEIEED